MKSVFRDVVDQAPRFGSTDRTHRTAGSRPELDLPPSETHTTGRPGRFMMPSATGASDDSHRLQADHTCPCRTSSWNIPVTVLEHTNGEIGVFRASGREHPLVARGMTRDNDDATASADGRLSRARLPISRLSCPCKASRITHHLQQVSGVVESPASGDPQTSPRSVSRGHFDGSLCGSRNDRRGAS